MTSAASLAHDVMRWTHFSTQEKPLLAAMALGALDRRERAAVRARVKRLWSHELERRRVARGWRVRPTRRESRVALVEMSRRAEAA